MFQDLKYNKNKLIEFGFFEEENCFVKSTVILNGQMNVVIKVAKSGGVENQVIDNSTSEPYILHLMPVAVGGFVGKVRTEVQRILLELRSRCFEKEVFISKNSNAIIKYISDKYHAVPEYLWEKLPNFAAVRRKDNQKWFAVLMKIPKNKLSGKTDKIVEVVNLKVGAEDVEKIVDNKNIFPAFHMNKNQWVSVCLSGNISLFKVFDLIDKSYNLVAKR